MSRRRQRGFASHLSLFWLAVVLVFGWHGHAYTACWIGGVPWMLHRRWERSRATSRTSWGRMKNAGSATQTLNHSTEGTLPCHSTPNSPTSGYSPGFS